MVKGAPSSVKPNDVLADKLFVLSTDVVQYIASCGILIGPGKAKTHAARRKIPFPGTQQPADVDHPLTFFDIIIEVIKAEKIANPKPTNIPCITSVLNGMELLKKKICLTIT